MDRSSKAVPTRNPGARPGGRPLFELFEDRPGRDFPGDTPRITGVAANSAEVTDGSLFVAIRGTRTDGHAFVPDAVRRGASAVVVERELDEDAGVPVIRVDDTRRKLAELAAAWYGHPAESLSLVGITGTVGKTSTLTLLEAILTAAGRCIGTIGSLGLHIGGDACEETGYTSPDPLLLHQALARIAGEGCDTAGMEVTSHALAQERVHGIEYDLGIFTNLVPLEHSDYHGSFRSYVEAKRSFFDHLRECAPLVYSADDLVVRRLVHGCRVQPVGCGRAKTAVVRIEPEEASAEGTRLTLNVRRPLPRLDGGEVAPFHLDLELRLLGRSNVSNAALAATAALCLGAGPEIVREVLSRIPPPRRRMQVVHRGSFLVLDDTVGHPDSISAIFEVAESLAPRRVHVACAVRGRRGAPINRQNAQALAVWAARLPLETLVVTRSDEAADDRNRVEDAEHEAFCRPLRGQRLPFLERDRLDDAVRTVLDRAREGDLVLLLGAQGMDRGQEVAREWLAAHADT